MTDTDHISIAEEIIDEYNEVFCRLADIPNEETLQAMDDAVTGHNVKGPFDTVEEMFAALEK